MIAEQDDKDKAKAQKLAERATDEAAERKPDVKLEVPPKKSGQQTIQKEHDGGGQGERQALVPRVGLWWAWAVVGL